MIYCFLFCSFATRSNSAYQSEPNFCRKASAKKRYKGICFRAPLAQPELQICQRWELTALYPVRVKDYSVFNPPKLSPGISGGGDVILDPATGKTVAAPEQYNISGQYGLILNSQQRQPKTHNQLLPTSYKFVLARAPQLTFYCQSLSLPTISTDTITQESPFTDISNPAGKISFEDLTLNFVVDEKMANWLEIYHWMTSLVPVDRLDEHSESANTGVVYPKDRFSDLSVVVTTNQSNAQIAMCP